MTLAFVGPTILALAAVLWEICNVAVSWVPERTLVRRHRVALMKQQKAGLNPVSQFVEVSLLERRIAVLEVEPNVERGGAARFAHIVTSRRYALLGIAAVCATVWHWGENVGLVPCWWGPLMVIIALPNIETGAPGVCHLGAIGWVGLAWLVVVPGVSTGCWLLSTACHALRDQAAAGRAFDAIEREAEAGVRADQNDKQKFYAVPTQAAVKSRVDDEASQGRQAALPEASGGDGLQSKLAALRQRVRSKAQKSSMESSVAGTQAMRQRTESEEG